MASEKGKELEKLTVAIKLLENIDVIKAVGWLKQFENLSKDASVTSFASEIKKSRDIFQQSYYVEKQYAAKLKDAMDFLSGSLAGGVERVDSSKPPFSVLTSGLQNLVGFSKRLPSDKRELEALKNVIQRYSGSMSKSGKEGYYDFSVAADVAPMIKTEVAALLKRVAAKQEDKIKAVDPELFSRFLAESSKSPQRRMTLREDAYKIAQAREEALTKKILSGEFQTDSDKQQMRQQEIRMQEARILKSNPAMYMRYLDNVAKYPDRREEFRSVAYANVTKSENDEIRRALTGEASPEEVTQAKEESRKAREREKNEASRARENARRAKDDRRLSAQIEAAAEKKRLEEEKRLAEEERIRQAEEDRLREEQLKEEKIRSVDPELYDRYKNASEASPEMSGDLKEAAYKMAKSKEASNIKKLLSEPQEPPEDNDKDGSKTIGNIKRLAALSVIITLVFKLVDVAQKIFESMRGFAEKIRVTATTAAALGESPLSLLMYERGMTAKGVAEGTFTGAAMSVQRNFGNAFNFGDALTALGPVIGGKLKDAINVGIANEKPADVLGMILDEYVALIENNKNPLGQSVDRSSAIRAALLHIDTALGPEASTLLNRYILDADSSDASILRNTGNGVLPWVLSNPGLSNPSGMNDVSIEFSQQVDRQFTELQALWKGLLEGFTYDLLLAFAPVVTWFTNLLAHFIKDPIARAAFYEDVKKDNEARANQIGAALAGAKLATSASRDSFGSLNLSWRSKEAEAESQRRLDAENAKIDEQNEIIDKKNAQISMQNGEIEAERVRLRNYLDSFLSQSALAATNAEKSGRRFNTFTFDFNVPGEGVISVPVPSFMMSGAENINNALTALDSPKPLLSRIPHKTSLPATQFDVGGGAINWDNLARFVGMGMTPPTGMGGELVIANPSLYPMLQKHAFNLFFEEALSAMMNDLVKEGMEDEPEAVFASVQRAAEVAMGKLYMGDTPLNRDGAPVGYAYQEAVKGYLEANGITPVDTQNLVQEETNKLLLLDDIMSLYNSKGAVPSASQTIKLVGTTNDIHITITDAAGNLIANTTAHEKIYGSIDTELSAEILISDTDTSGSTPRAAPKPEIR